MWKHKNFINLQLCATFKHFYDAGTIGSGTVKFRHYSQQEPSSATLINFTINGTAYQAEEGMTWQQWVNSSYNTGGFYVHNNRISTTGTNFISTKNIQSTEYAEYSTNVIAKETVYYLPSLNITPPSGGGGGVGV